jgi:hypothetical protein
MFDRVTRTAALSVVMLALGAFTPWPATSAPRAHPPRPAAARPAAAAATSTLPAYATRTPELAAIYRWAANHREELQYIPCACGCESLKHKSNWNCFAKAEPSPGKFVWDDHGAECIVCQQIALEVKRGLEGGRTLAQIRMGIEVKWGHITMKTPLPPGSF